VGGPEHQVQEVGVARVALEAEQGRLELGDAFATLLKEQLEEIAALRVRG